MPNWCFCNLQVRGEREQVKEFETLMLLDRAQDGIRRLDFGQSVPMPRVIQSRDPATTKYKDSTVALDWYGWSCDNWGTKWNACSTQEIERDPSGAITLRFDTAWSPPHAWLEKTSLLFPWLTFDFSYEVEGDWGKGDYVMFAGEVEVDLVEETKEMQ